MAKKKNKNKLIPYTRRGDKIEITVRDSGWSVMYKREVTLKDRLALKEMENDLRHIGIDLKNLTPKPKSNDDWFT